MQGNTVWGVAQVFSGQISQVPYVKFHNLTQYHNSDNLTSTNKGIH